MDDLTLIVGNGQAAARQLSGWQDIRVTRGIERLPSDFDIGMTERFPGEMAAFSVMPGDACQVKLGNDLVITGYIDRIAPTIGPRAHSMRVSGRSKCCDLVDCAAEWPNGQINGASTLEIAEKLAKPYGISVSGEAGVRIPQYNISPGSTAFETIELICRYSALLAYDQPDGNLYLSQVSETKAASGFKEGVNVEQATAVYSMDQRYSEYFAWLQSVSYYSDVGEGGNIVSTTKDTAVPRHRRRIIIVEAGMDASGRNVAQLRALWEASRRYGRSACIRLTTDTWRDKQGTLWTPNTQVLLELPSLKTEGKYWTISEVTYRRDGMGTHADLILMPPIAFTPEPITLQPEFADVVAATGGIQ